MGEARQLMNGLRPAVLDDFGIVAALENLVADQQSETGPAIDLTHDVGFERLAFPLEVAVFRIVQEGLVNALRHADSDRVEVRLVEGDRQLTIEISDRGVGFDPAEVRRSSFGLEGIRQRARLFNGHASIDSVPGRGTRITVVLPLVT